MDKKYVSTLLDNLIALDQQTSRAYYEMGQLLHSFRTDKLYAIVGYESFAQLVEEELTFSVGTATSYIAMYAHFKRLKYTKNEALGLLQEFGYSHMSKVLGDVKQKLGARAIKTRIESLDLHQINFTLTAAELNEVHAALAALGAKQTEQGRYMNSTSAFMEMVRSVKCNKKAA